MKNKKADITDLAEKASDIIFDHYMSKGMDIMKNSGREKAKDYAASLIIPQLKASEDGKELLIEESSLLDIARKRAQKRAEEVEAYFEKHPCVYEKKDES